MTVGHCWVTVGHCWVTVGHSKTTSKLSKPRKKSKNITKQAETVEVLDNKNCYQLIKSHKAFTQFLLKNQNAK